MNLIYPPLVNSFKVCLTKVKLELVAVRCNYSIVLIVSKLRFKYTKLYLTGFTPPILTIQALLKHPFFTVYKYNDYIWIFVSFGVSKFHINLWVSGFFVNFALYDRYNS